MMSMQQEQVVISNRRSGISYAKGKLLGKGGFASVFEIREIHTNGTYADKIISKEITKKKASQEKIRREIELHRKLIHPNVVRFVDTFEDDASIHIILEYCGMKSLLHLMKRRKVLQEEEVRFFLKQICDGVTYIHQKGIVHRDLKLGNMFLTSSFIVKIGDFGLATSVSNAGNSSLCGTPNYIAPEVLQKKGHGFEADVWAIGCMTYAMMSGNPPFETKSLSSTYAKIASNSYTLPASMSLCAKILIRQLLHPDPASRGNLHIPNHPMHVTKLDFFTNYKEFEEKEPMIRHSVSTGNIRSSSIISSNKTNWKDKLNYLFSQKDSKENYKKFLLSIVSKVKTLLSQGTNYKRQDSIINCPLIVTKWIDYSNKYGFGYELSNGTMGVLFNDNIRVSKKYHQSYFDFVDEKAISHTFNPLKVPQQYAHYTKILEHFGKYMEDNLADCCSIRQSPINDTANGGNVQVVQWTRNDACVIMLLNNKSLQINFFASHEKLVFWERSPYEMCVTFLTHNLTILLQNDMDPNQLPLSYDMHLSLHSSLPEIQEFEQRRQQYV